MTRSPGPVFFDLDGTLVESAEGIVASLEHALAVCGVRAAPIDWRQRIGPPVQRMLAAALPEVAAHRRDEIVAAFRKHYGATGIFKTTVFPGIPELMQAIATSGRGVYVVTNKPQQPAESIVRHVGLQGFVRRVVGGDPDGQGSKPDRTATLVAEEKVAGGVFVGDGVDDLHAAERVGAGFLLAGWGYGTARVLAERPGVTVVHRTSDLWSLLQAGRLIG